MTDDVLVYNKETEQWENRPIEFLLEDYLPTLTVETDNVSIENVEGILQLKDFGIGYYAYIPAIVDEETGEIISPSSYEYTEGFKSGLEPRIITDEDNNLSLAWYEPGAETVEDIAANLENISKNVDSLNETINAKDGLSDQVQSLYNQTEQISATLEEVKSTKADINNVYTKDEINTSLENIYTKEETNIEIGKAVAAADHLKRIIVKDKTEIIDNYFDKDNYDTYIFMVPIGFEAEADKYNEYIIVEIDGMKAIEKVGSWEVNLADYATKEEIGYVEGSRLITDDEATKLANLLEGAEKNIINSVSSDFSITEDRQLNLNNLSVEKITDLADWLNKNAGTQKGLSENNLTDDLYTKLTEAIAIKSVSNQLKVESGNLSVVEINSNQVKGLTELLQEKASMDSVLTLESNVTSVANALNSITNTVTQNNTDIKNLQQQLIWHNVID